MTEVVQELMTPDETAKWFRRSAHWLRHAHGLLHIGGRDDRGQPLYHVTMCRAYVLGRLRGLLGDELRQIQLRALAAACGLDGEQIKFQISNLRLHASAGAAQSSDVDNVDGGPA